MAGKFKQASVLGVKLLLGLAIFVLLIAVIGHFGLQYGMDVSDILSQIRHYWWLWLGARILIYVAGGVLLHKIQAYAKDEADLTAYQRLTRACLIGAIGLEVAILLQ